MNRRKVENECRNGHTLADAYVSKAGKRTCRTFHRANVARYRAKPGVRARKNEQSRQHMAAVRAAQRAARST